LSKPGISAYHQILQKRIAQFRLKSVAIEIGGCTYKEKVVVLSENIRYETKVDVTSIFLDK